MRKYGSIQTKFWTHPDIQKASDQAKLLASYLLSSSHTNMLGCFRIPTGYIAEDLTWDSETVTRALDELIQIDFLMYDKESSWVFINNFLKYHPIENYNQGLSIAKLFEEIPKKLTFLPLLIPKLLQQPKYLKEEFCKGFETVAKPFLNQEQEQNQEQYKEQEIFMSGKPDEITLKTSSFEKNQNQELSLKSQAEEILAFLNQKTGRSYRSVETNLKLIIARLKSGATLGQCFQIIAKKTREWRGNAKMDEYLRPATLFNAVKFEQYVGELVAKKAEEKMQ